MFKRSQLYNSANFDRCGLVISADEHARQAGVPSIRTRTVVSIAGRTPSITAVTGPPAAVRGTATASQRTEQSVPHPCRGGLGGLIPGQCWWADSI